MSKAQLARLLEAVHQEGATLDYRRLALERQIVEVQAEIGAVRLKMASLQGQADLLAQLMEGEEDEKPGV